MNTLMGHRRPSVPLIAGAIVLAALLPFAFGSQYALDLMITATIWITLNQSWNLTLGFAGIWNFGQLALFAIGGYVGGILAIRSGVPAALGLVVGGLAAAVVSVVLSVTTLRLRGIYVALLTFSFAEVVRLLVIADDSGLTGGTFGLSGVPGLGLGSTPEGELRATYWVGLALVVVTTAALWAFLRSPAGLAVRALRDSPGVAIGRGVSPLPSQVLVFAVSAFFAGVAGAFYAFHFGTISPSVMGLATMTLFVTMLVVGGLGTLTGPIVGTILIMFVSERLRDADELRLVILGAILLAIILTMPRGVAPALDGLGARLSAWMAEDEDDEERRPEGDPDGTPQDETRRTADVA